MVKLVETKKAQTKPLPLLLLLPPPSPSPLLLLHFLPLPPLLPPHSLPPQQNQHPKPVRIVKASEASQGLKDSLKPLAKLSIFVPFLLLLPLPHSPLLHFFLFHFLSPPPFSLFSRKPKKRYNCHFSTRGGRRRRKRRRRKKRISSVRKGAIATVGDFDFKF